MVLAERTAGMASAAGDKLGVTVAIDSVKGGGTKTTVTSNLASALAIAGHKVLVVDNDPQAAQSEIIESEDFEVLRENSMYHVYEAGMEEEGSVQVEDVAIEIEGRYHNGNDWQRYSYLVAPAHVGMTKLEINLPAAPSARHLLREATRNVRQMFDYTLFDCAPGMGLFMQMPLVAADYSLIPFVPDRKNLRCLDLMMDTIRKMQVPKLNPDLMILGVVLNRLSMVRGQANQRQAIFVQRMVEAYPDLEKRIFRTPLTERLAVYLDAQDAGTSVFDYSNSAAARLVQEEYVKVAQEFVQRVQRMQQLRASRATARRQ